MIRRRARPADIDLDALREAVGAVRHPGADLSLAQAGLLGQVTAASGCVRIEIARLAQDDPDQGAVDAGVRAAAALVVPGAIGGTLSVELSHSDLQPHRRKDLGARLRARAHDNRIRPPAVIGVASGKGGVGKSTVTANLATSLARAGRRVGVLDADVWGFSVPQLFGVRTSPVAVSGMMLPVGAHGVRLMSVGFFVEDDRPVMWRGPMLDKAIAQFAADVAWGELDVLLVDLPPGTGDVQLSLIEHLPGLQLLVVTTPQRTAVEVAARVGRMALESRLQVAGVVENMSSVVCGGCGTAHHVLGTGGGQDLASRLSVPLLAQIPMDEQTRRCGDEGTPVVAAAPHAPAARALSGLAAALPLRRPGLAGRSLPLSVQ